MLLLLLLRGEMMVFAASFGLAGTATGPLALRRLVCPGVKLDRIEAAFC